MLFNTYQFIFIFLIPTVIIYLSIPREFKIKFLILVSTIFYSLWSVEHLLILLSSIIINYFLARKLENSILNQRFLLFAIISLNLLPLIYYKYSLFLTFSESSPILPLAISFFTFQQIAFQFDIYKKKQQVKSFEEYLFFILFFPQLVAGPIVHYKELIPQTKEKNWGEYQKDYFNMGIILFSIGLFKKVVLADNLAPIANYAFANIETISNYDAWLGIFAYTFQIYFDFSGYSDMAIGLALFFGIKLPINFNSPYKARNIIEFWRNWHITLSNFLRDHIYIPLGGNRVTLPKQAINILITMAIGGIWHGSGWTFIIWGILHGLILIISHRFNWFKIPSPIAIFLTFFSVLLLWVIFRADNLSDALSYYTILFNFQAIPINIEFNEILLLSCSIIIFFLPNSLSISQYLKAKPKLHWYHSLFVAILFFIALKTLALAPAQTFVYFNF